MSDHHDMTRDVFALTRAMLQDDPAGAQVIVEHTECKGCLALGVSRFVVMALPDEEARARADEMVADLQAQLLREAPDDEDEAPCDDEDADYVEPDDAQLDLCIELLQAVDGLGDVELTGFARQLRETALGTGRMGVVHDTLARLADRELALRRMTPTRSPARTRQKPH